MRDYRWLHEYCLNRFGSVEALEARLPQPKSPAELASVGDDRYLSLLSLRVFRAGLKHSLVDAKWPAFEQVFFGFDPEKVVLMGAEHLERLMQDARLIRHLGKLKSVPRNAQFILDVVREKGSFGALIADWPVTDVVGHGARTTREVANACGAGSDCGRCRRTIRAIIKASEGVRETR